MHLRTSYPVETQAIEPEKVADALGHFSVTQQKTPLLRLQKQRIGTRRKSSTTPTTTLSSLLEDHGNVLREVDEDNMIQTNLPSAADSSSRPNEPRLKFDEQFIPTDMDSPLAAGYQPMPNNLQAITDALIAASYDPSTMAGALAAELRRSSAIAPNTSRLTDSSKPYQRVHSERLASRVPAQKIDGNHDGRLNSSAKSPGHPVSPPKQLTFTDENINPPAAVSVHNNGPNLRRDEFLRPSVPAPRAIMTIHGKERIRESQYGSGEDSEDSLSVASSVRSSHSSIAFEIPNEPVAGKSRRIPAPRPISGSSGHRGRGSKTEVSKRASSAVATSENRLFSTGQTNVASLFLPSAIPNEESFVSLETPLQRNPKCLNEPSNR
ncbi:hypothetical protein AHF37_07614 [Paragonimus kellicotti]|nr:hypothetical protein AHF37_07614 [Paragonimus kellicotti]